MNKEQGFKNKLKNRISNKKSSWLEQAEYYERNKDWLDKSALIALRILRYIRAHKITQKELAGKINVSPQYINKVVKGKENLSLETICKIENALEIILIEIPSFKTSMDVSFESFSATTTISRIKAKTVFSSVSGYDVTVNCPVSHMEELEEAA